MKFPRGAKKQMIRVEQLIRVYIYLLLAVILSYTTIADKNTTEFLGCLDIVIHSVLNCLIWSPNDRGKQASLVTFHFLQKWKGNL